MYHGPTFPRVPMARMIGKYEVIRSLGAGAMGEVFLAHQSAIGREVAIKTILPAATQGTEAKQRFEREARAAGVLNHPNLVTIYEFGQDQGVPLLELAQFGGGEDGAWGGLRRLGGWRNRCFLAGSRCTRFGNRFGSRCWMGSGMRSRPYI